jgi:hypothetical protein
MAYAQTSSGPFGGPRALQVAFQPAAQTTSQAAAQSAPRPLSSPNVIPFPAPRVLLPITLPRETPERAREQLRALLHSPLGVYVAATEITRLGVRVQLNIAPEDIDFAMHTLIATLPAATIGSVTRRNATAKVR